MFIAGILGFILGLTVCYMHDYADLSILHAIVLIVVVMLVIEVFGSFAVLRWGKYLARDQ